MADLWDSEESARRGFACTREWKERISSREYERAKAIGRKWLTGDDRRDYGLAKAAYFIASAMAKLGDFDLTKLLPNVPETPEQTPEDMFAALQAFGKQWQPKASEPSPPS